MIKHDLLENRLNAVRKGIPAPHPNDRQAVNNQKKESKIQNSEKQILSYKQFFINEGYKTFNVLAASILYGYGIKALVSSDWNFLGTLGVGFLLNHFITIILKLFKK